MPAVRRVPEDTLTRVDTLAVMRAKAQVDGKAVLHDLFDHYLIPD